MDRGGLGGGVVVGWSAQRGGAGASSQEHNTQILKHMMTIEQHENRGICSPLLKLSYTGHTTLSKRGGERGERKIDHTSPRACVVLEVCIRTGCSILPCSLSFSLSPSLSIMSCIIPAVGVCRCTQMILLYFHHSSLYILAVTPTTSHTYHLVCPGSDQ